MAPQLYPSPRLLAEYARTRYVIDVEPEPLALWIGETNPAVDQLLEQHKVQQGAFITAWNPLSEPLPAEENAARTAELERLIRAQGFEYLTGRGIGPDPTWVPEESFFILGIRLADAETLARKLRQFAYLWHQLGKETEINVLAGYGEG